MSPPTRAAPPGADTPAPCRCKRFTEELAAAEALFARRGEGVSSPLDNAAHARFRERVDTAYASAGCLALCGDIPEIDRNAARVLLAAAAFKTAGLTETVARERLTAAVGATEHCLAIEPTNADCHLWHASARGILARDSWNPLNLRLPAELLEEFRSARGDAPPGYGPLDGASTRGEALLLLRAPRLVGGDPAAALRLIEVAATTPRFNCTLSNRLLLVETLARTGAAERALDELRATVTAGLPSCGLQRYENALALEEARRCLSRLEAEPAADPGWDDDCRGATGAAGSVSDASRRVVRGDERR